MLEVRVGTNMIATRARGNAVAVAVGTWLVGICICGPKGGDEDV